MIKKILANIYYFFYKKKLQYKFKLKLGEKVYINRSSTFEGSNFLAKYSALQDSHMGYGSYIAERSVIRKTLIGKYSSIGPDVKCIFGKHPSHTFVSTHPAFFSTLKQAGFSYTKEQLFKEYEKTLDAAGNYSIIIGNDVWIGAGVSLMDGVTIGDGAILAANSLIVKDVEPYTIVGGVPAKVIKYRFEKDEIEFLNQFKWWEKKENWIKENSTEFKDIKKFIQKNKKA